MKRILFYSLALCLGMVGLQHAVAQRSKASKPAATKGKTTLLPLKKLPEVEVALGRSSLMSGTVSKRTFDSVAKQRLQVTGGGAVQGFTFTYAEHNLYEDSVGNPLRLTEYLVEYCIGDTLSAGVKSGLFDRTKPGDTAYFNDIKVLLPSGQQATGKTLKFAISR